MRPVRLTSCHVKFAQEIEKEGRERVGGVGVCG